MDEVKILHGALEMRSRTAADVLIAWDNVFMVDEATARIDQDFAGRLLEEGHSRVPVHRGARENLLGLVLVKELLPIDCDGSTTMTELARSGRVRYRLPVVCTPDISLLNLLNEFQKGHSHMAFVVRDTSAAKTVVEQLNRAFLGASASGTGESGTGASGTGESGTGDGGRGAARRGMGGRRGTMRARRQARPGDLVGIVCLEDLIEVLIQEDIWDESDRPPGAPGPPPNVQELRFQDSVGGRAARTVSEAEAARAEAGDYAGETRSMMRCGSETSLLPVV
jgi:metal transporter CNNM